ncbi:hypothetical protein [Streptomyces sp. NPDC047108]|uniref:hypothetical protein n=1 Tax=Streptomyces sp. NPDC047108 TaxID=3155025 RepID=UPI00340D76DB
MPYVPPQPQPGGYGFGPPVPPAPSSAAGRGWLWALGGAGVASVVWAAVVFATGGFPGRDDGSPDLAGYTFREDICPDTDLSAAKKQYPEEKASPKSDAATHKALDAMWCTTSLEPSGAQYSSATVTVEMWLYKATDPTANFEAQYESFDQRGDSGNTFSVRKVPGIGDVAYLVTPEEPRETGSSAYLAVRDGWMTYQMSFSNYVSSSDTGVSEPDLSEIEEMLKQDTKATLRKLGG